jgi:branched-subunit amino acid ABC-type transport system permease component
MLVIEDVTAVIWEPRWAVTVFYILLVVILLVRPQGLLGKAEGRKQ